MRYRTVSRLLVTWTAAVICCGMSFAQLEDQVHITPRVAAPTARASASRPNGPVTELNTHTAPIKVDVDMVLVPVTITDPYDRLVTGLEKENFKLYEGKHSQPIRTFSSEDAPVSVGIIFDMSGSMEDKIQEAREAVVQFMRVANPQDEFFLISFNDKPEMVSGFTTRIEEIQNRMAFVQPKGLTSLLDAIYLGMNQMERAKHHRKALLIISDGGDNHSRYTENEIKSRVQEADVQIYGIGIYSPNAPTPEERMGPALLSQITEATGGRTFTIDDPNELADVATKIGTELRNEYVLGYKPSPKPHDGKWHKIKVKLLPPKGLPPLNVFARKGYYADSQR